MTASRLLALACATVLLSLPARAQLTLSQTAIGVTSADGSGGTYALRATLGEPAVGVVSGGSVELCQGIGCVTPQVPEAFEVTSPIQDDYFVWGDPINVRWTTLDATITPADRVRISLVCTGQAPIVRFASAANTGAKGFLMPASVGTHGGPADGGDCRAEVALETDPSLAGLSQAFATQDPALAVPVTEPERFDRYGIGDPFTWRWDASALDAAAPGSGVDLRILCEGRADFVAFAGRPNNGARGFLLPTDFGAYDNCHAEVSASSNGTVFGRSPSVEILDVPLPSVEITAPTGGATLTAGQTTTVQWSTLSTDPTVSMRVLLDDFSGPGVATVRLAQTDNDGSFVWSIPTGQAPGTQYRLRIAAFAQDGTRIVDVTEFFAIQPPVQMAARRGASPTRGRRAASLRGAPEAVGIPLERGWTRVVAPHATDAAAWLTSLLPAAERVVARDGAGRTLSVTAAGTAGDLSRLPAGAAVDVWVDASASLGRAPALRGQGRTPAPPTAAGALAMPAALWRVETPALADGDAVVALRGDTVVGRGQVVSGAADVVVAEPVEEDLAAPQRSDARASAERRGEALASRPLGIPVPLALRAEPADGAAWALDVAAFTARSGAPLVEGAVLAFVPGADWVVTLAGSEAAKGASADEVDAALAPDRTRRAADLPDDLALLPVVPNPTRGRATVRVALPEAAPLAVRVYDVRGRAVVTLADGADTAAGWHDLAVRADRLAAGVYVVRVEAAGEVLTRTFTVLR